MTLDDLCELIKDAAVNAHLFVQVRDFDSFGCKTGTFTWTRVTSASLRMDDDGVLSVCLHAGHMPNRVRTDEADRIRSAIELLDYIDVNSENLNKRKGEFTETYVHEGVLLDMLHDAGIELMEGESYFEAIPRIAEELTTYIEQESMAETEVKSLRKEIAKLKEKLSQKTSSDTATSTTVTIDESLVDRISQKVSDSKDGMNVIDLAKSLHVKKEIISAATQSALFDVDEFHVVRMAK